MIYVEELIGADTVNTIPPATYDAFRDHGRPQPSLEDDLEDAHHTMDTLAEVGIAFKPIADQLLADGVKIFVDAFAKLLAAVTKRLHTPSEAIKRQTWTLPEPLTTEVRAVLKEWADGGKVHRLWARDATLWTSADESRRLGWLGATDDQLAHVDHLRQAAENVRAAGFTHAVLLGMGGTVLGADALARTLGQAAGFPELRVLDSTDPAQIRAVEKGLDLTKTLFIVSSKSGSTLEPNALKRHFFEAVKAAVGPAEVGRRFIAITDPESKMQYVAEADRFRRIFFGLPSLGGRFSALSDFGMVPGAMIGLDIARLLGQADEMVHSCAAAVPVEENPGAVLGIVIGVLAKRGRDKVTLVVSPAIQALGTWVEQLLTASLGKAGRGVLVVDGEPLGAPAVYGADRLFVHLRLESAPDAGQDAAVAALQARRAAGGPHRRQRAVRPRRRVLPLAVRRGGGRRRPRHQPVRPARHRGRQDRRPQAHRRVRQDGRARRPDAVPGGRRARAVRRRPQRRRAGQRRRRWPTRSAPTWAGPRSATTWPCCPSSR